MNDVINWKMWIIDIVVFVKRPGYEIIVIIVGFTSGNITDINL